LHENPHAERDNVLAAAAITAWFGGRRFGKDKGETGKGRACVLDTNPVFANAVVSIPGLAGFVDLQDLFEGGNEPGSVSNDERSCCC